MTDGEAANPAETTGGAAYGAMIEALRDFLDKVAGANPDRQTLRALDEDLRAWSARLARWAAPENDQPFGRRSDLPGLGQTMWPLFLLQEEQPTAIAGTVTFGRYFLGANGAVHGGALSGASRWAAAAAVRGRPISRSIIAPSRPLKSR